MQIVSFLKKSSNALLSFLGRSAQQKLPLVIVGSLLLQIGEISLSTSAATVPDTITTLQDMPLRISSVSSNLSDEAPLRSGLIAYDNSPLGKRTPLVLVHGIASTANHKYHWENFLEHANGNKPFAESYKIYFYHYDSCRSVPLISKDIQQKLQGFIASLGGRNIKILAYSEGGLLTRNAMQNAYINEHTLEVLTIATPFHGSPLANPDWLKRQVATESPLSLVRMGLKQAYSLTGHRYPSFKEDFHWDNFDGSLSAELMDKKLLTGPVTDYALAHKTNFTTYGSYFGTDVDPGILRDELGLTIPMPKERPNVMNLFRKNFLFSLIRNNIGRMPLAKVPADKAVAVIDGDVISDKAPASLMMFNDGISPISSSLWLGRYLPKEVHNTHSSPRVLSATKLWNVLRSLRGTKQARLFAGLDHRNWMDGNTRTGNEAVADLLNPGEKPRSVFDWIIDDLMS